MAQWAKDLLHQPVDSSSGPQYPDGAAQSCNPRAVGEERGRTPGTCCLASQSFQYKQCALASGSVRDTVSENGRT